MGGGGAVRLCVGIVQVRLKRQVGGRCEERAFLVLFEACSRTRSNVPTAMKNSNGQDAPHF